MHHEGEHGEVQRDGPRHEGGVEGHRMHPGSRRARGRPVRESRTDEAVRVHVVYNPSLIALAASTEEPLLRSANLLNLILRNCKPQRAKHRIRKFPHRQPCAIPVVPNTPRRVTRSRVRGQPQVVRPRQLAHRNRNPGAREDPGAHRRTRGPDQHVRRRARQRGGGVYVGVRVEDSNGPAHQHVPHYASESGREHAARHSRRARYTRTNTVHGTDDAERADTDGVAPIHPLVRVLDPVRALEVGPGEERGDARADAYPQVFNLLHPERASPLAQQQVPYGPTAHRGDRADDGTPQYVHTPGRRREGTSHGEHGGTEPVGAAK
mmetsp:Transcript_4691/g.21281  ORF Transcript_4691/g.21281 Transcript_4691/m.21281 type:complete len:322 (-) Transcript_4691:575-1540(-)